jgi:putative nucleotidyltransferase with HDIG domain
MTEHIPTYDQCIALFDETKMRENIRAHSMRVADVACAIAANLKDESRLDIDLVRAGALLHDITKTRALESGEHHDISGGEFLRQRGCFATAEIVAEHVRLTAYNPDGPLLPKEIVHYADKRVLHDRIVTLRERIDDLMIRYGKSDEHRNFIRQKLPDTLALEQKIRRYLSRDLDEIIAEIR